MISFLYLAISLVALVCLIWGIKLYLRFRDIVFLLILAPLFLLWYDCFIIGIGHMIGEGEILKTLSWPRYIAHALLLPTWIIAAGALARRADFDWAKSRWVMGLFCLLGTAGMGLGVVGLLQLELFPACQGGTLRFVPHVSDHNTCRAGMAGLGHAPTGPPPIPILSTVLFLIIGLMMWIRRKWPWLFLGSLFMFFMAAMPQSIAGPLLSNIAEPIIAAAALFTARHFLSVAKSTSYVPL